VGDAQDSYAYDGKRLRKWNVKSAPYGQAWTTGGAGGEAKALASFEADKTYFLHVPSERQLDFDKACSMRCKMQAEAHARVVVAACKCVFTACANQGCQPRL
jgi:hypothetical protein